MYVRITYPKIQAFTSNGQFAAAYEIHTYVAGTSTAAATYSERTLTTANTNPVVLNSRGEADIYVGAAVKLVFTESGGDPAVPIWTVDYVGEADQLDLVSGDGVSDTHNNYAVTLTPILTSLSDRMMLVMTPSADNEDTIVSQTFTGAGIDDAVFTGPYIGTTSGSTFTVQIDGTAPDTFKWRKDAGTWTELVAITGAAQTLAEGVVVTFSVEEGHTLTNFWTLTVETPVRVNVSGLGGKLVYKNVGGLLVALDGGDMKQDIPATLTYSADSDCFVLNNPSDPVLESLVPLRTRKIKAADYTITADDRGHEICCNGALTITLPDCNATGIPGSFFYVSTLGTGIVTVDAGAFDIIGLSGDIVGVTSFTLAAGGFAAFQLSTNGVTWHVLTEAPGVPTGTITAYGGTTAPTGWLLCQGQSLLVADYPGLYSVIGYAFGGAVANFTLPDLRQRFPMGRSTTGGTAGVLGAVGGSLDFSAVHTHDLVVAPLNAAAVVDSVAGECVPGLSVGNAVSTTTSSETGISGYNPAWQSVNYIIKV